jgi:hypothetical protein
VHVNREQKTSVGSGETSARPVCKVGFMQRVEEYRQRVAELMARQQQQMIQ